MLAKQLWRLHDRKDSLIAKYFKARYYPNHDVWNAKVGHYPSCGWRSILGSRHMLSGGLRWKVGDGKCIKVWKDAWLDGGG